MFTWIQLDNLPTVPQKFVDQAFEVAKAATAVVSVTEPHFNLISDDPNKYFDRKILVNNQEHSTRHQWGKELDDSWSDWVKTNIIPTFINTGVRVSVGNNNTTWHGAHVDAHKGTPKKFVYKLYYLLDAGGSDVDTVFYKEFGSPAQRTEDQPLSVDDYSKLEVIDRVRLPLHKWILLNTSILHGVENVTGPRTNLTVGIEKHQFDVNINLKG